MSSTEVLDQLRAERDKHRATAIALIEAPDYDPNSEAVKASEERAAHLDAQIERLSLVLEQQRNADAIDGKITKALAAAERGGSDSFEQGRESLGEAFIRSEQFTSYKGAPRGRSGILEVEARALPTGLAAMATASLNLPKTTRDNTAPAIKTPLLDAVTTITVSTNSIEYVAWSKVAGGADKVAEGATKPSAEFAPAVTASVLDTIAVWTQLTRQLVEDAPAVRDKINGELVVDVQRKEESEAAAALAAATLPTVVGSAAAGDDLLTVIRAGIGTVQAAGYEPTHVLLNPADWAELDNVVMGSTLNGPTVGRTFWGLIPIAAASQPAGTATVGDFQTAIERYVRSNIALYITDSHADTFLKNVFTLLAERRSKTVVVRPQALVEVSVGA